MGAVLLAPPPEEEAAHDELLRADLSRSDSATTLGFADGVTNRFADDVLYLRGGLPILRGKPAAREVVAAESLGTSVSVRWQPVRAEVSADLLSGFSYGYTVYGVDQAGAPSLRIDRYIAYWRKEENGWRIAGYAETYGAEPPVLPLPLLAIAAVVPDKPMTRRRGALEEIRAADENFSRDATKFGTGDAFGRYAAASAQMFSAPGEFITGPEAITRSFGPTAGSSTLVWHPVDGEIARSGDLGFTVGNAVFTGEREDSAPVLNYSKYLTVWKKQRDGQWRFVVDGGSARPKQ